MSDLATFSAHDLSTQRRPSYSTGSVATAADATKRLQSCGRTVTEVTWVRGDSETRVWRAQTDDGGRRVTWRRGQGWTIERVP